MFNIYICLRVIIFGIFITSHAIITSVAVWSLSLSQAAAMNFPVVSYLIFIGAFGLAFIFVLIFLELAWSNPFTSRISFECSWVGLFFVLELAGAAAFSALVPPGMCTLRAEQKIQGTCVSSQVLQSFTWISAIALFIYLITLLVSCFIHRRHGSALWRHRVNDLQSLSGSTLSTKPTLPQFLSRNLTIVAPRPQRPPPEAIYSYRSGLGPEYEIEYYQPPTPLVPAISPIHQPSLYPQVVQSSLAAKQPLPSHQGDNQRSSLPLGNWPRVDVLKQPVRNREHPVSEAQPPLPSSRRRPSGPRYQPGSLEERHFPPSNPQN